jgi:hypothetical protein
MKLSSLTIATLATTLLSAFLVQAKNQTPALRRGLKGANNNGADNYFALVSAAQQEQEQEQDAGCIFSALLGNAVATVRDNLFCIKFSYAGLSSGGLDLFSHIHGPAAAGETGPIMFFMDTSSDKTQCFELTKQQMKEDLDDGLWYFDIHSEMCPNGAIRGQILPLLSNVDHIVKQLRQVPAEAVTEARTI